MSIASQQQQQSSDRSFLVRCLIVAAIPLLVHILSVAPAEPVFDGDSNRHMMTSVFFRDFIADGRYLDPKTYAEAYYEQYPALGLLIWPPLFHGICGVAMLAFGTSTAVARGLIFAFLAVAAAAVYRMTRRAAGEQTAMLVTIVFSTLPLVFRYSRDVMLEMPSLALVLLSAEQFDRWIREDHRRSLYISATAAAAAALTRFDAVMLLPFYFLSLLFNGQWKKLRSVHVVLASLIAICIIAPVYAVILRETGSLHMRQAAESVGGSIDGSKNAFLSFRNFLFYPSVLAEQAGVAACMACVFGLAVTLLSPTRKTANGFIALLLATYLTFSPLAELRSRHAIYWLPSVAFFAVAAVEWLARRIRNAMSNRRPALITGILHSVLISCTAIASLQQPSCRVEGYRDAAEYVLQHTSSNDRVFFDGWWDGNFTYYMRHLDPSRSRHVVRGDKLLYDFVCVPATDFRQYVESSRDILQALLTAAPRYVIVENPQFYQTIAVAQQLRDLIHEHPELFIPVHAVRVSSTLEHFVQFELEIFEFDSEAVNRFLAATEKDN